MYFLNDADGGKKSMNASVYYPSNTGPFPFANRLALANNNDINVKSDYCMDISSDAIVVNQAPKPRLVRLSKTIPIMRNLNFEVDATEGARENNVKLMPQLAVAMLAKDSETAKISYTISTHMTWCDQ